MGVKTKNSHLNINERKIIERMLDSGHNFKYIADYLNKSSTTISREVYKNRVVRRNEYKKSIISTNSLSSKCKRYQRCTKKNICGKTCDFPEYPLCKNCFICTNNCNDYEPVTCAKINKPPYVCNSCDNKIGCRTDKYYYYGDSADKQYHKTLSESRQVLAMNFEERKKFASLIAPLIKQGQSISVIRNTHPEWFCVSVSTIYGYIEDELLPGITAIDLIEKVQRKHHTKRRKTMMESKTSSASRIHRTYIDFLSYINASQTNRIWELDTVMGRRGDNKSILTLLSRESRFMFAFILEQHTCNAVAEVFNALEYKLGIDRFHQIFPVILTDNGTEFIDAEILEQSTTNDLEDRTKLFYCDPNNPNQKGMIEKNHEFLRRIIHKGNSINFLRQQDLNLAINHINSYSRESNNWSTPYKLFAELLDKKEIRKLNLVEIPPDQIILKPKLLSERKKQYQAQLKKNKSPN